MRKITSLALVFLLSLACACTRPGQAAQSPAQGSQDAYMTADSIAVYVIQSGCGMDPAALERMDQTLDEDTLHYYFTEIYGLEDGSWSDCAVYRAGGTQALEIAVFRMGDAAAAESAVHALTSYIQDREGDFTGYEPEQADIVHQSLAVASQQGDAALLICPDAANARSCFLNSYDALRRADFVPPNEDDMTIYDTSAVLAAWESGDRSALSEKDAVMLEKAAQVLDGAVTGDMTELERERAVYRWITSSVVYDQDHYDKTVTVSPDSYSPYGPLTAGKGVCLGVASTFQLLMDMTGVECITVVGASRNSTSDHAWNMVRLNGQWYCVDPTWDLGDAEETWAYFNVTSDKLASTDHQWDYDSVPEAVATDGGASPDPAVTPAGNES